MLGQRFLQRSASMSLVDFSLFSLFLLPLQGGCVWGHSRVSILNSVSKSLSFWQKEGHASQEYADAHFARPSLNETPSQNVRQGCMRIEPPHLAGEAVLRRAGPCATRLALVQKHRRAVLGVQFFASSRSFRHLRWCLHRGQLTTDAWP